MTLGKAVLGAPSLTGRQHLAFPAPARKTVFFVLSKSPLLGRFDHLTQVVGQNVAVFAFSRATLAMTTYPELHGCRYYPPGECLPMFTLPAFSKICPPTALD